MANKKNGTIYVGSTTNLVKRVHEHKNKLVEGFTKKYGLDILVYYEIHNNLESAAIREKRIKHWQRQWKSELIEKMNPEWQDLYSEIV